jgi:peptide/nickel transport system ATP-binding protein
VNSTSERPPILQAVNLGVKLYTEITSVSAVRNVNYSVSAGETLAIVGESGSGKTIMNFAPLGLLPAGIAADYSGSLMFEDVDLLALSEDRLRKYRGGKIGVVFQDPLSALNPSRKIGRQIAEVAETHLGMNAQEAEQRAMELLKLVGIPDPGSRLRQYPHELSGGMRQRVVIAAGIAGEPKVLVADEPTTALDVTVQAQIIELLKDLQKRLDMAVVLITHDIGVVSGMADKVAVMYGGTIVEYGTADAVLVAPQHPYTRALLDAVPRVDAAIGAKFNGLAGLPPDLSKKVIGCAFAPRCSSAVAACSSVEPSLVEIGRNHYAACPILNPSELNVARG